MLYSWFPYALEVPVNEFVTYILLTVSAQKLPVFDKKICIAVYIITFLKKQSTGDMPCQRMQLEK